MRSDHWNFLANLLGTPGPAAPPKPTEDAKAKEKPPKTVAEPAKEKPPVVAETPVPSAPKAEKPRASGGRGQRKQETPSSFGGDLGTEAFGAETETPSSEKADFSIEKNAFGSADPQPAAQSKPARPRRRPPPPTPSRAPEPNQSQSDDVLDALSDVNSPQALPGFGAPARSAGESSYDKAKSPPADPSGLGCRDESDGT